MKKTSRVYLGFLLAAVMALPAFAQQTGSGRYDKQIENDVTKLLNSKDKWKDIKASTEDGIVTLNGSMKVLVNKMDVGKKVSKVDHVTGFATTLKFPQTCRIRN